MSKRKPSSRSDHPFPSQTSAADWRQQGLRAFHAGRFDQAISNWSHVSQKDAAVSTALAEAYFRRALTRFSAADHDQQIADLRCAAALRSDDLRYLYHLGLALHRAGDLPAATKQYQAVLQRDPAWPGLGLVLALAMLQQDPRADISTLPVDTPEIQGYTQAGPGIVAPQTACVASSCFFWHSPQGAPGIRCRTGQNPHP